MPPSFHNEILLAAVKHKLKYTCAALSSFFVLKPNGLVSPCLHFSDVNIGSIKSRPMAEIWRSKKADEVRKQVEKCEGCSNSWATTWSFNNWPYPFIGMRIILTLKTIAFKVRKNLGKK